MGTSTGVCVWGGGGSRRIAGWAATRRMLHANEEVHDKEGEAKRPLRGAYEALSRHGAAKPAPPEEDVAKWRSLAPLPKAHRRVTAKHERCQRAEYKTKSGFVFSSV